MADDHEVPPLTDRQETATEQPSRDELIRRARDAGWTETTAFNYDEFTRTGGSDGQWHGASAVYEWREDYGDVAPAHEGLEQVLFGGEFAMRKGEHFEHLELTVTIEGPVKVAPARVFEECGLHPVMVENIKKCGYDKPTPIQQYTIPAVNKGMDIVAVAQTGSGKTAAYMIPVISRLMGKAKKLCAPRPEGQRVKAEPLVVIVVPTRELAMQIFDEARRLCYRSMLRPCVLYGGLPMGVTISELTKGCDVLISTPGRLCDFMDKPDILTMSRVKYTIIDEADEMLNQDWADELNKIMAGGDTNEDADHVYLMFSATFPKAAREMARQYMVDDYLRIRVGRAGQSHKNIRQNVIAVDHDKKREAVYDLLFASKPTRTLIFCNSKLTVDLLDDYLYNKGLPSTSIHADRNQIEREDAFRAFRTGKAPILIATGVSSRGWDIAHVNHVINYDLPSGMYGGINEYIHRIGRTARIGHQGLATSFYTDRNEDIAQDLVNVLMECDCEVPDFLQHLVPEDGKIAFDDDTDDEDAGKGGEGEDGAAEENGEGVAVAADSAWGAPTNDLPASAPAVEAW